MVRTQPLHHCPNCIFTTNTHENLLEHQRTQHIGTRCRFPGCSATRESEWSLRQHIRYGHSPLDTSRVLLPDGYGGNKERFNCCWPTCNKNFTTHYNAHRCAYLHQHHETEVLANQPNQIDGAGSIAPEHQVQAPIQAPVPAPAPIRMSESHVGSTQGQQYRLAHHQSLPIAPINQSQLSNEQGARAPDQNYSALMDTVSRTRTELAFVREDLSDRIYATIDRIDTGMTALQTTQTEILNTLRAISDGNPLSRSPSNEPAQPPTQGAQEEQARKRGREEDDDTESTSKRQK